MRGMHFVSGMATFLLFATLYRTQAQERNTSQKTAFEVESVRPIVPPAGRPNPCNIDSKPLNLSTGRISGNRFRLLQHDTGGTHQGCVQRQGRPVRGPTRLGGLQGSVRNRRQGTGRGNPCSRPGPSDAPSIAGGSISIKAAS